MKIETLMKQGILIVRLKGEFDIESTNDFKKSIDNALNTNETKDILLNLQEVSFIDSSGLGVILGRYKNINLLGGQIVISNINPKIKKVLELSGFEQIMQIAETEEEALALFN
ncbi:anti-sigma F factor antagonist [Selenomonadales bacterium OttesenSCG-928-I06]|nr:anti-sigma F factor antagonist [Selenomonadales bacterium OttesenSCG-928-I06]